MSDHIVASPRAIYSAGEIAPLIGAGATTIKRWMAMGLPTIAYGKQRRLDLDTVRAWMAEHVPTWGTPAYKKTPKQPEDNRPGVVYAMIDPRNGRTIYIGKAHNYRKRCRDHIADLNANRHGNPVLQRWFNKYRVPPTLVILQECLPGMMDACEIEWIARARARAKAKGYRLFNVAEGGGGGEWSEERRRQQSERTKRLYQDPAYVARYREGLQRRFNNPDAATVERRQRRAEERERNRAIQRRNMEIAASRRLERDSLSTLTPLTVRGMAMLPVSQNASRTPHSQRRGERNYVWFAVTPSLWAAAKAYRWHAKTHYIGGRLYTSPRATIGGKKTVLGSIAKRLHLPAPASLVA